jgi:hypothetical protein
MGINILWYLGVMCHIADDKFPGNIIFQSSIEMGMVLRKTWLFPRYPLLYPVEPFNEASTLSLSTLAVPQILYSTEPVLASGLDREGGTDVQGRPRQLSIPYLESEISHQYGKEACIHSTLQPRILLRKESRSYEKVRIYVDESVLLVCCFRTPLL